LTLEERCQEWGIIPWRKKEFILPGEDKRRGSLTKRGSKHFRNQIWGGVAKVERMRKEVPLLNKRGIEEILARRRNEQITSKEALQIIRKKRTNQEWIVS